MSEENMSDQVDLGSVKKWLSDCETNHSSRCQRKRFPDSSHHSPGIYLVDVLECCIVEAALDSRFLALSYVWGRVNQLRHLKANTVALKKAGSLKTSSEILRTIRDAMQVVHTLGERYLWVDTLCICQDDDTHKAAQIAQMAEIYDGALATIVACTAENANTPLPGIGSGTRSDGSYSLGDDLLLSALVRMPHRQRAWTFQEVVLSRRCIFFFSDKVVFQCQQSRQVEGDSIKNHTGPQNMAGNWPPIEGLEGGMLFSQEFRYGELIHDFSRRDLTIPSDRLDAFTGLTSILSKAWHWRFHFAIPAQVFGWAILWVPEDPIACKTKGSDILPVRSGSSDFLFPSWSWLSHPGASFYYLEVIGPQSGYLEHYVDWSATQIWTGKSTQCIEEAPGPENQDTDPENSSTASLFRDYPPGTMVIMGFMASLAGLGQPNNTPNMAKHLEKAKEYQQAGIVYTALVNGNGQWYGTLVGVSEQQIRAQLHDGVELSLVLLSSAAQTWVMGGFRRKIPCFDEGIFKDENWCTVNVMLINSTSRPYRRVAIGEVHRNEWDKLQPQPDLIWLA